MGRQQGRTPLQLAWRGSAGGGEAQKPCSCHLALSAPALAPPILTDNARARLSPKTHSCTETVWRGNHCTHAPPCAWNWARGPRMGWAPGQVEASAPNALHPQSTSTPAPLSEPRSSYARLLLDSRRRFLVSACGVPGQHSQACTPVRPLGLPLPPDAGVGAAPEMGTPLPGAKSHHLLLPAGPTHPDSLNHKGRRTGAMNVFIREN